MPEKTDVFAILSRGRIIDLGSRLDAQEIAVLAGKMSRTCPDCMGMRIMGTIGVLTPEGMLLMPVPCETCEGTGELLYLSPN